MRKNKKHLRVTHVRHCQPCSNVCAQTLPTTAPRARAIVLRKGDVVLLKTHQEMNMAALKRFHEVWQARFGDQIKIAILHGGDWEIDVLHPVGAAHA